MHGEKNGANIAFGANLKQKRFDSDETEVPGPGMYVTPSSVVVKDKNRKMAAYKSEAKREIIQL